MLNKDYFLGFDRLMRDMENFGNNIPKYPPHNIIKEDGKFKIEMALAGFAKEDVSIEIKNKTLKVVGEPLQETKDYVFKGISSKGFEKSFVLGEHIKVIDADMINGLLSISLEEIVPEENKPLKIEIK
jgi:molecular chaperone IbpA